MLDSPFSKNHVLKGKDWKIGFTKVFMKGISGVIYSWVGLSNHVIELTKTDLHEQD